jgi:hypothetical protein
MNYIVCPSSFPDHNQYPTLNQRLVLRQKDSDTANGEAIALIFQEAEREEEWFCGWVRRWETPLVLWHMSRQDDGKELQATVWGIDRRFFWTCGGGRCVEGRIAIIL